MPTGRLDSSEHVHAMVNTCSVVINIIYSVVVNTVVTSRGGKHMLFLNSVVTPYIDFI